jgi:hypothetical protein
LKVIRLVSPTVQSIKFYSKIPGTFWMYLVLCALHGTLPVQLVMHLWCSAHPLKVKETILTKGTVRVSK